jgi:hypothetical protein
MLHVFYSFLLFTALECPIPFIRNDNFELFYKILIIWLELYLILLFCPLIIINVLSIVLVN